METTELNHATPGWARGEGILNTWLPASTLFQWRWRTAATHLPGVGEAPMLLLIIWLQVWAMENGKAARGSPATHPGPGVRPIDILV